MMDRRASDGVGIVDTPIVAGTDEAGNTGKCNWTRRNKVEALTGLDEDSLLFG